MTTFPYSNLFDPPAPSCQIYLSATRRKYRVGPLPALLDTGADATLIPQRYLTEINATRTFEMGYAANGGNGAPFTCIWSTCAWTILNCQGYLLWAMNGRMKLSLAEMCLINYASF